MRGPSLVSPALDKSLLHFCCTDSDHELAPSSAIAKRKRSNHLKTGALPIASPSLLSVREVAGLLRVSWATVYRLCEHGDLPHIRVSNAIRIAPQQLQVYLTRSTRKADCCR